MGLGAALAALAGSVADMGVSDARRRKEKKRAHKYRDQIPFFIEQDYNEYSPEVTEAWDEALATILSNMRMSGAYNPTAAAPVKAKTKSGMFKALADLRRGLGREYAGKYEQKRAGITPAGESDILGTILGAMQVYNADKPSTMEQYMQHKMMQDIGGQAPDLGTTMTNWRFDDLFKTTSKSN